MSGEAQGPGRAGWSHGVPVVDLHLHGPDFLPSPIRQLYMRRPGRPAPAGLETLRAAGVDVAVVAAVGDPIVTRWHLGRSAGGAVAVQLTRIARAARRAGLAVARTADDLRRAANGTSPAVVLAVEGADALGSDTDAVDAWHDRGVRLVGLVHLGDNRFATTSLPWQRYAGPLPVRRRTEPGLSALGRRVVARLQARGIVVDLAHADRATVRDVVSVSEAPVVVSHSGARAVQEFARYLSDEEVRAIASTGGVIGLWPYRGRHAGVRDVHELVRHARHVADLVGPAHLSVGTDMNGVPGLMAGYRGIEDLPTVADALRSAGFSAPETAGVLGGNALRVLTEVLGP